MPVVEDFFQKFEIFQRSNHKNSKIYYGQISLKAPIMTAEDQGSKIALVRSYLRVPQAAGQVKILLFLVKIKNFPIYANNFCDAGQVPILRYFEAWGRQILP